jgi:mevalonate kinase
MNALGVLAQKHALQAKAREVAENTPRQAAKVLQPMHTEPGKHLAQLLTRLQFERDGNRRAQIIAAAMTAAHALDEAGRVATQRMADIKAVADFLMAQGIETVCLDGAPDVLLEMLTEPEETEVL